MLNRRDAIMGSLGAALGAGAPGPEQEDQLVKEGRTLSDADVQAIAEATVKSLWDTPVTCHTYSTGYSDMRHGPHIWSFVHKTS